MDRLSIPLHRTPYTTRRTWRVVWFFALILFIFSVSLSVWYGRNTTAVFIPSDSVAVLRFSVNRFNQENIRTILNGFPLISGRTITFEDLKTAVRGEFSVFFMPDGASAVAIRSEERLLPRTLLDAHGVLIQQVRPHVFLLSSTMVPLIQNHAPGTSWIRSIHPFSQKIGSLSVKESLWATGGIFVSSKKISIYFPQTQLSKHPFTNIPEDTIAVLSLPTSVPISLNGTFRSTDRLLTQFNTPTVSSLTSLFSGSNGGIILTRTKENQSSGFLFATEGILDMDQTKNLLKTATALKTPVLKTWRMPDNSKTQEIIVDPSLVSIQEYTAFGTNILRATTGSNESIFMAKTSRYTLISNNEELLRGWFQNKIEKKKQSCVRNHAFLSTKDVLSILSDSSLWIRPSVSLPFIKEYPQIGIQKGLFSSVIQFCK